jgi:hemerythrin-like domain-containing protein
MSLKRHPGLVPLSHQHHSLLVLANGIKEDSPDYDSLPTDTLSRVKYVLAHQPLFESHTQAEDEVLFPFLRAHQFMTDMARVLQSQHRLIDAAMHQLSVETDTDNLRSIMDNMGYLIEAHIRKEERELFPAMQNHFTDAQLKELGSQLVEAMQYDGLVSSFN